jgi:hypothetical protein
LWAELHWKEEWSTSPILHRTRTIDCER